MAIEIEKIHHVAYRCKDAKETIEWYGKNLNMDFILAIAEDQVPSTKEPDPYMHIFLDAGNENILAFFEIPNSPDMTPGSKDPNTPSWVQHLCFRVGSLDKLIAAKEQLEANGVDVLGPTDHTLFKSIYFHDPNGHRLELAANVDNPDLMKKIDSVKWAMVEEWTKTRKAPMHAAWMHETEFSK